MLKGFFNLCHSCEDEEVNCSAQRELSTVGPLGQVTDKMFHSRCPWSHLHRNSFLQARISDGERSVKSLCFVEGSYSLQPKHGCILICRRLPGCRTPHRYLRKSTFESKKPGSHGVHTSRNLWAGLLAFWCEKSENRGKPFCRWRWIAFIWNLSSQPLEMLPSSLNQCLSPSEGTLPLFDQLLQVSHHLIAHPSNIGCDCRYLALHFGKNARADKYGDQPDHRDQI